MPRPFGPFQRALSVLRRPAAGALLPGLAGVQLLQTVLLGFLIWHEPIRFQAEQGSLRAYRSQVRAESAVRALIQEREQASTSLLTSGPRADPGLESGPVEDLETFRREIAHLPGQSRLAADLDDLILTARGFESWIRTLGELVRSGRRDEAVHLAGTEGEQLQRALLAKLQKLSSGQRLQAEQASSRLAASRRLRRTVLQGSALLALLSVALIALLFQRQSAVALAVRQIAERASWDSPLATRPRVNSRLDVTLRLAANRVQKSLRQRDTALAASAEELAAANEELRMRAQDMEAFVRGLSHDLRSPLATIKGFSREVELSWGDLQQLLAPIGLGPETRGRLDALGRDLVESVHYLKAGVEGADRIVAALQKLAHAGHRHYEWQHLQIEAIVTRVVASLRAMIAEKNAEVAVGALPNAWGDPVAVEQIFANLVKNAVLYLDPDRPGRVEIGAEPSRPGEPLTYWVRDNGIGIPAEHLRQIFTAFKRLHAQVAEGEGIGLALVQRAVLRLGGQIRVESQEGAGTTFFVTLRLDGGRKETPLPWNAAPPP